MLHGRLEYLGKTLTGLQISGCDLHQNAFGFTWQKTLKTVLLVLQIYRYEGIVLV